MIGLEAIGSLHQPAMDVGNGNIDGAPPMQGGNMFEADTQACARGLAPAWAVTLRAFSPRAWFDVRDGIGRRVLAPLPGSGRLAGGVNRWCR